jgi:hypothetical protein
MFSVGAPLMQPRRRPRGWAGDDSSGTLVCGRYAHGDRKLLELHYADKINADLFPGQERAIWVDRDAEARVAEAQSDAELEGLIERFDAVVSAVLQELDLDRVWAAATDQARGVLIDELLDGVAIFPDHLEVTVHGAPRLNVLLSEVGLGVSQNAGVGGGT